MKTKLLLLLVLLIPSLCFGEALQVRFDYFFDKKTAQVKFTSSEFEQKVFVFKTHTKYDVFTEDNERSFHNFALFLNKHFPKAWGAFQLTEASKKGNFNLLDIQTIFEDVAVMNGYAKTHDAHIGVKTQEMQIFHYLKLKK